MKNLMISKKQAEDFSGVEVRGQEVFMESSNEEFDDLEEIKASYFSFVCSYTEGYIDFEQHHPQKGQVIIASGYRLSSSQFSPT